MQPLDPLDAFDCSRLFDDDGELRFDCEADE